MFLKKLDAHLNTTLEEIGFEKANSVQKKSIGQIKSGGNIILSAPQQSGKSTALVIAIIQLLREELNDVPRAIVVVKDKEAALALQELFVIYGKRTDLRVHAIYDEGKIENQKDLVYLGSDVVIGTAKRLNKLYSYNGLNLNELKMFAVDNASEVMYGVLPESMDRLTRSIPQSQIVLTTADLSQKVERYAELFMSFPQTIVVETEPEAKPEPEEPAEEPAATPEEDK